MGLTKSRLDGPSVASGAITPSSHPLSSHQQPVLSRVTEDISQAVVDWVPEPGSYADLTRDNMKLQAQLLAQLDEVRQSRTRLVEAAQEERRRVERDLHDGAQQQLVALLLSMQLTKATAARRADTEMEAMLEVNITALREALSQLRELARGIYPSILTEAGLVPAVRSLAERSPIRVEVNDDLGDSRLPAQIEAALYFVAAEAITNAIKHSNARQITLALKRAPGLVAIDISDDGAGGADITAGTGLRGLSDRVAGIGGRLQVESDRQHGTVIHTEIPCA